MSASIPPSIPDSQLGLSTSEIHLLRQHQQIALQTPTPGPHSHQHSQLHLPSGSGGSGGLQQAAAAAAAGYATSSASRGRGHARSSASTSRNASAASSAALSGQYQQHTGRLVLDAGSLAVLGQHFERLMAAIQNRVEHLSTQTQMSTISQSARAGAITMAAADAEILRFRDLLRQIDELEVEFDKVRHIRDIVKGFRSRVEGLERKFDAAGNVAGNGNGGNARGGKGGR